MTKIFVKGGEYNEFSNTLKKGGKVYRFWVDTIRKMPNHLRDEVRNKPTFLTKTEHQYRITGALPFQFSTSDSSSELVDYLDNYVVFVEHDTVAIVRWRKKISLYLTCR